MTDAAFQVPKDVLEGRSTPFPSGSYLSHSNKVEQKWSEDKTNLDFVFTLSENTPIEGANVGKRSLTDRITVIFKGQSVVDLKGFDDNTPFALRRAATILSQLAQAWGISQPTAEGGVTFDIESFMAGLVSGLYAKQPVAFEVYHRAWTSKDKTKSGVSAQVARFYQPQSNGAVA